MWRAAILQRAEKTLLDEKASKLMGLARMLEQLLGDGFENWLTLAGASPDVTGSERVRALNLALTPMVGALAEAFPGVGLGHCDAVSGRVVTYCPTQALGHLVGVECPPDHLGWIAMKDRADKVAIGSMVRGDALNCVHPIIRRDRVIGFTFASESLEDIYRQFESVSPRGGHQAADDTTLLGLSALALFASSSAVAADALQKRLLAAAPSASLSEEQIGHLSHQLRQIDRYVRLFLQNLNSGVLLVGENGLVAFVSRPLQELTGVETEALLGLPWEDALVRIGLPKPEVGPLGQPCESPRYATSVLTKAGGDTIPVDLTVACIPGEKESTPNRLFLLEDTRRMQQAGEYFLRAERLALAGELATAIAHEIRNPITVVAGSVQLIPQRLHDEEFLLDFADIADRELSRVNRIIQQMLGFARYSEPDMNRVDLQEVIVRAVEFTRWYAEKRGVTIITELAGHLTVQADASHLQQALLNLMMNGIQAMPNGGDLTIRLDHPPRSRLVRIQIQDQGIGLDPEHLAKIWEVFYSSKPGGTGLGLPVVQRIVDEHRGYVEVTSALGKGTCFTILLPLVSGFGSYKEP